jgi:hypothetical protein
MIKILSLMPPWPWLMTHGLPGVPMKDVENRTWATNYRGLVLVHASKNWDGETFSFYQMPRRRKDVRDGDKFQIPALVPAAIKEVMPPWSKCYPMGGVVGMFTIVGLISEEDKDFKLKGKLTRTLNQYELAALDSPWFFGKYGFVVKDAKPLPFTPWKGQLGLRDAPPELLALLGLDQAGNEVAR